MNEPFEFRPARPEDHADFARLFVELGHDDPIPDPERWRNEWMSHTHFLHQGDTRLGYACVEHYGEHGYVRHVVVGPTHRGRGVGRAMMQAIAAHLRRLGAREWQLNVRRENEPAIHLYETVGMRAEYATFVLRLEWALVERLPVAMLPPRYELVDPGQDEETERAFALPRGILARFRAHPASTIARLVDDEGRIVGVARFDPTFPGAFPFRVAETEYVRTFLEALQPLAPPKPTWLQLVVENDLPSAALLLETGARLVFEIIHMRGKVPT